MSVSLIVVLALSGAFLLTCFCDFFLRLFLRRQFERTKKYVTQENNYICYTQGAVGSGKSTMDSGICNVDCAFLRKKCEADCERFLSLLNGVDKKDFFELCDSEIDLLEKEKKKDDIVASCKVADVMNSRFNHWFDDHYYWDYISGQRQSMYCQMKDYIDARIAIKENWFCYSSSGSFIERDTGIRSKPINRESLNIKDSLKNPFRRYAVVFIDDKTSNDPNNGQSQKVNKEDGGYSLSLQIIRHIGTGNDYYIANAQNFTKDIKGERSLANGIYNVEKNKRIRYLPILFYFSSLFYSFCWAVERIMQRAFRGTGEDYADNIKCASKNVRLWAYVLRKAKKWHDWVASKDYVVYSVCEYFSSEDVGKVNPAFGKVRLHLYFPVIYCFGSMPRYEYANIYDYLNGGHVTEEEKKRFDYMLKKNNEKAK